MPHDHIDPVTSNIKVSKWRRILRVCKRGSQKWLIIAFLSSILSGIPSPIIILMQGKWLNSLNGDSTANSPEFRLLPFMIFNFILSALFFINLASWSLFGNQIAESIRRDIIKDSFDRMPLVDVEGNQAILMTKLKDISSTIVDAFGEKTGLFIQAIAYCISSIFVGLKLNPYLTVLLSSAFPIFLVIVWTGNWLTSKYTKLYDKWRMQWAVLWEESLTSIKQVRIFELESKIMQKNSFLHQKSQHFLSRRTLIGSWMTASLFSVAYLTSAVAFFRVAHIISHMQSSSATSGPIEGGNLYAVLILVLDGYLFLATCSPYLQSISSAAAQVANIAETAYDCDNDDDSYALRYSKRSIDYITGITGAQMIKTPENEETKLLNQDDVEVDSIGEDMSYPPISPAVLILKDVSYSYGQTPPALKQISACFKPGNMIGIVGESGSGKTTLLKLLSKFLQPSSGAIHFNKVSLRNIPQRHWRCCETFVCQESFLLPGTVLENIAMGLFRSGAIKLSDPENDSRLYINEEIRNKVEAASRLAQAHEFIKSLPHGYDTEILSSYKGFVSTGQRQRIILARAFISGTPILILDEACSAVDPLSEQLIEKALLDYKNQGNTVISVTHRVSSVKAANYIYVLKSGLIVEEGLPEDLLKQDGYFAHMLSLQSIEHDLHIRNGNTEKDTASSSIYTASSKANMSKEYTTSDSDSDSSSACSSDGDRPQKHKKPRKYKKFYAKAKAILRSSSFRKDSRRELEITYNKMYEARSSKSMFMKIFWKSNPTWWFCIGIIAAVLTGGVSLGNSIIFGRSIGLLNGLKLDRSNVAIYVASQMAFAGQVYIILGFIIVLSQTLLGFCFGQISQNVAYNLEAMILASILSRPIQWFDENVPSPLAFVLRVSEISSSVSGVFGQYIGLILAALTSLVGGICTGFVVSPEFTFILLFFVPILFLGGFMRFKIIAKLGAQRQKSLDQSLFPIGEALSNIKTIRSYCLSSYIMMQYNTALKGADCILRRRMLKGNLALTLAYALPQLMNIFGFWIGSILLAAGRITQFQFMIVIPAVLHISQGAGTIFAGAPEISNVRRSFAEVLGLVSKDALSTMEKYMSRSKKSTGRDDLRNLPNHLEKEQFVAPNTWMFHDSRRKTQQYDINENESETTFPAIELENVIASYGRHQNVLKGLSLTIEQNKSVAFVGVNGSGKSTTLSLLLRFYEPQKGTIKIFGRSIKTRSMEELYKMVAYVPQEARLFSGTVLENIVLNDGCEDRTKVRSVCETAQILKYIESLPLGFETVIGVNGIELSGGQKQRLMIARALYRGPKILLLDEATAAIDAENEHLLVRALLKIKETTTIIQVVHRIKLAQRADKIFVFGDGRIIEEGTHEQLMSQNGLYFKLASVR